VTVVQDRPAASLVLPSADDPFVAGAVTAVGGPPGRHARLDRRRFWTPVRVVIALTLLACTLGFLQKLPCRDGADWVNQHQYTHACYMDLLPLYGGEGLAAGEVPYFDHNVEYPVLIGGIMQVTATLVKPFEAGDRASRFVDINIALLTACAVITAICVSRLAGRRPWDGAMFALAPGLILAGFINWDLPAAALMGLGMLAWARKHPLLAGILVGLGGATKLYPLVLLAPLALLCIRAGRWRALFTTVVGAVAAWAAVNVPIALAAPEGWKFFYTFSQERGADWGSIWYFLQYVRGTPLDVGLQAGEAPHLLNLAAEVTFAAGLLGVAVLTFVAKQRPRVPQVMFLTLVAFCLSNKVYSPQYVIWLLPLAVLARPRWRSLLVWQAGEVLAFFGIWYYLIGIGVAGQGISGPWYFTALLLRDALLIGFSVLVVRDILRPEKDVVRRDGVDDPAGGPLDGAPDAFSLRRRTAPVLAEGAGERRPQPAA